MGSWIFQGNPDRFNMDKYIGSNDEILWQIRQKHLANRMHQGDEVFIWRAAGSRGAVAGVVCQARMVELPRVQSEDLASQGLWTGDEGEGDRLRVRLRIEKKCLGLNEVVKRNCAKEDPILRGLRILVVASETNYELTQDQAERLSALVRNVVEKTVYKDFGEAPNDDEVALQEFARRVRRGQPKFRANLMKAYQDRCCISGTGPETVLEAVHLFPHTESGINKLDNGLLLRADLHSLFDAGLLRVHPETLGVELDGSLRGTDYWQYQGKTLCKRADGGRPSKEWLSKRWGDAPKG